MRPKTAKIISIAAAWLFAAAFLFEFGRAPLIRAYLYTGIGNCHSIPILCAVPREEFHQPPIDKAYLAEAVAYKFQDVEIVFPKGFKVIRGEVQRAYYKKLRPGRSEGVVYLLYQKPGFFIGLFPQVKKQGITDNRAFLKYTMNADIRRASNLTDAFFVVMKSIFTPDIGRQEQALMASFLIGAKSGFINYNLGEKVNYFDCNILDKDDGYFKVYIKDQGATLDLDKVLAIISTVNKP